MKIGNLDVNGRVILAPMAGVTSLAYRDFMKPFGVALSYSEMISDCGLFYGNESTLRYFKSSSIDHPLGLQLFGSDTKISLKALEILENNAEFEILDLNMGCPVNKVVKTGAGSAWLKRQEEIYDYVHSIVQASHHPVSVKIRLGWDDEHINVNETSKILQDAGVSLIGIHARTREQGYSGKADFTKIENLGERLSVPIAVSGDIYTPQDALEAMRIAKADFVMVARGGLGNPMLVTNINHAIKDEPLEDDADVLIQADWAERFATLLIEECGEREAIMKLKGLLPHFFSHFPGYKKIRGEISMNMKSLKDLENILAGIRRRNHL